MRRTFVRILRGIFEGRSPRESQTNIAIRYAKTLEPFSDESIRRVFFGELMDTYDGEKADCEEVLELLMLLDRYPQQSMDEVRELVVGLKRGVVDGKLIGKRGMVQVWMPNPDEETMDTFRNDLGAVAKKGYVSPHQIISLIR